MLHAVHVVQISNFARKVAFVSKAYAFLWTQTYQKIFLDKTGYSLNNVVYDTIYKLPSERNFITKMLESKKQLFFYLPYLSSIHEKAMYRYVLDGESALAWELPFPAHLSST